MMRATLSQAIKDGEFLAALRTAHPTCSLASEHVQIVFNATSINLQVYSSPTATPTVISSGMITRAGGSGSSSYHKGLNSIRMVAILTSAAALVVSNLLYLSNVVKQS